MPKKINLEIAESVEFLQREHSKAKGLLKKDRIKTLLYIKEGKYHFQSDISKKLGRSEKTICGWLQQYLKEGYSILMEVKSGGNNTKTISEKARIFIAEKVKDKNTTITSYIELQLLLEEELGERGSDAFMKIPVNTRGYDILLKLGSPIGSLNFQDLK
jgi:biotin operon repressor